MSPPGKPIPPLTARQAENFARKIGPATSSGCLPWTGHCSKAGYGLVMLAEAGVCKAHRVAWTVARGPIPEGLTIDHVRARGCELRSCCNVEHMELVTLDENKRRARSRNRELTHCPAGHPYTGDNLKVTRQGWRVCRTCDNERMRLAARARRAAAKAQARASVT